MVAGLEGDDGSRSSRCITGSGEGIDLGMSGSGTTVVALGDHRAVGRQEHTTNAGVGPLRNPGGSREHECAAHRVALAVGPGHLFRFTGSSSSTFPA
ncbi:unannotated protein [freshwater metagenome]|uniref:Unannotated protein n=1 Tax=freshwater metagenome TaxID=449393 RepID=A0A6J7IAF4_9ZZZZ